VNRLAFSQRWLEDNDKERKPFSDELFTSFFFERKYRKIG